MLLSEDADQHAVRMGSAFLSVSEDEFNEFIEERRAVSSCSVERYWMLMTRFPDYCKETVCEIRSKGREDRQDSRAPG